MGPQTFGKRVAKSPTIFGGSTTVTMSVLLRLFGRRPEVQVPRLLDKLSQDFEAASRKVVAISNRSFIDTSARDLKMTAHLIYRRVLISNAPTITLLARLCRQMVISIHPDVRDMSTTDLDGQSVSGGSLFRVVLMKIIFDEGMKAFAGPLRDRNNPARPEVIIFFSELLKLKLPHPDEAHVCIRRLLSGVGEVRVQEEALEALCLLYTSAGGVLECSPISKQLMDGYFGILRSALRDHRVPWTLRQKVEGVIAQRAQSDANRESGSNINGVNVPPRLPRGTAAPSILSTGLPGLRLRMGQRIGRDMQGFYDRRDVTRAAEYFRGLGKKWHVRLIARLVAYVFEAKEQDAAVFFATGVFVRCAVSQTVSRDSFNKGFAASIRHLDTYAEDEPRAYDLMAVLIKAASLYLQDIEELARTIRPYNMAPRDKLLRALHKTDDHVASLQLTNGASASHN